MRKDRDESKTNSSRASGDLDRSAAVERQAVSFPAGLESEHSGRRKSSTMAALTGLPLLLIALYALSILLANLTLNSFIPLPVFGLLSVGTIFFAAVFTLRDRIHQAGGLRAVYIAIALALVVNTLFALVTGTPWRFIGASFLALLTGELADTGVYQRLIHRNWWTRVLASNAVSVPLDSVIFNLLAFWGDMPTGQIVQIIYADILAKFLIAAVFAFRVRRGTRLTV